MSMESRSTKSRRRKPPDVFPHLLTRARLGWLYAEVGDLDRAIEFNQRSSRVGLRRKDPGAFPNAELNLGENFLAREDLVLAGEAFEKIHRYALAPDTSRWMRYRYSIRLYAGLAELWLRRGKPHQGESFLDQSLDLATPYGARKNLVRGWRLKGEYALARKEWAEAEGWLHKAWGLAEEIGNPPQMWKSRLALGEFFEATGKPQEAAEARRQAGDIIERTKQGLKDPEFRQPASQD